MKRLRKAFFRNSAVQSIASALAAAYLWLVYITTSWAHENQTVTSLAWSGSEAVIIAFWHNRLILMPYCWRSNAPFHMLISGHADGQLISKTIRWHGLSDVKGSSSKGGTDALREMVQLIKKGVSVGITPDGPRGPRIKASDGSIALAKLSGAMIVPAAAATSRRIVFKTWDRLIFPLPFSRGACVWGEPIHVPSESGAGDLEQLRYNLETSLIAVSDRADILVGHNSIVSVQLEDADRDKNARA
ncbi:MAG: lysophospholipid acyltransferase family protein [Rhodospirillaceae bacterium]